MNNSNYCDDFKMRSFTKEETVEYDKFVNGLFQSTQTVSKERYCQLKEAFLNLRSDLKCYCNRIKMKNNNSEYECYYCKSKDLAGELIHENIIEEIQK